MFEIGQAAKRSGLGVETIRFYEREGVVPPPARRPNGRRTYGETEISRLRFVKRTRDLGFPLPEAKALLELTMGTMAGCDQVRPIAEEQLLAVRTKIDRLRRLERSLAELVESCSNGGADCPILEELLAD